MMQRSKTKSTKLVRNEREGLTMVVDPLPCREQNERGFFFGWIETGPSFFTELLLAVFDCDLVLALI